MVPICLFVYNRLSSTQKTVEALEKNILASESQLFIFSDGPKGDKDEKVGKVREYIRTIQGFAEVHVIEAEQNKGLANSIIDGVTQVITEYGAAIVLEDDLVTTPNFLLYMNEGLSKFGKNDQIMSICGYGLKIKKPVNYEADIYLYGRSSSWGWGTWKDRWESVDWQLKDWYVFKKDRKAIRKFNRGGSDMFKMLKSVAEQGASSWAIRFCYAQFKQNRYSIMPFESLVQNIGFGSEGTNTRFIYSRFKIALSKGEKTSFNWGKTLRVNEEILKSCYQYHSLSIRIYSRIRYTLGV